MVGRGGLTVLGVAPSSAPELRVSEDSVLDTNNRGPAGSARQGVLDDRGDRRDPAYFRRFEAELQAQGLQGSYRVLGVIARQDMLVLLAHCMVLLNPSRFEGWSTTVEEAKALGKPLLVSDIAVHREQLAGRADAQLFGVDDESALASCLSSWQQRHGQGHVTGHPPQPDAGLYAAFASQYIGLLREVSGMQKALA